MAKFDLGEIIALVGQILAYIIAIILIIQILRVILGGSWEIEEIILALVIFNLTTTFGIGGYLIHLNNKISKADNRIEGHIGWHKGIDNGLKNELKRARR